MTHGPCPNPYPYTSPLTPHPSHLTPHPHPHPHPKTPLPLTPHPTPNQGDPWRKGHMVGHHVPWRDVIGSISYPEVGTEAVKNDALRIAQAR